MHPQLSYDTVHLLPVVPFVAAACEAFSLRVLPMSAKERIRFEEEKKDGNAVACQYCM